MEEQPGRSTGCVAQGENLVAWNRFRLLPGLCGAWSRFANDGTSKLPCARPFKPQVMGFQDAVIAFLPKVLAVAEGRDFSQPQQIIICAASDLQAPQPNMGIEQQPQSRNTFQSLSLLAGETISADDFDRVLHGAHPVGHLCRRGRHHFGDRFSKARDPDWFLCLLHLFKKREALGFEL